MRTNLPIVILCLLATACSSGGSAASTVPHAASGAREVAPPLLSSTRHVDAAPTCSGVGAESFIGGGNSNVAAQTYSAVLAGYANQACDGSSAIGAGQSNSISSGDNTAGYSWIGAGIDNEITGHSFYASIGAGEGNTVSSGDWAYIGGGALNDISGFAAAIGGGYENTINGEYVTVGGGYTNTASGEFAVIGGGFTGTASGEYATVAGGNTNSASGVAANVAGGANNVASGGHATVLGGSHNTASGSFSLAAGLHSNATMPGSFVWTDESDTTNGLTSSTANQFLARAAGGFTLWTNAGATVGATLAPGSGAWASTSDRNMKTDVVALDDAEVLDRVGHLPISSWSYVTEHGVRHMGPMAQDFYAAFNVGEDNRHITSIDEDGVALAAIKALRDQNTALRAHLAATDRQIATLTAAFRALKDSSVTRLTTRE